MNDQTSARIRRALHTAADDVPNDLDLWPGIYQRLPDAVQDGVDTGDRRAVPQSSRPHNHHNVVSIRRPVWSGIGMAAALVVGFVALVVLIVANSSASQGVAGLVQAATVTIAPSNGNAATQIAQSTSFPTGISVSAWSPDGTVLVTGLNDGTLRLWRSDGTLLGSIAAHTQRLAAVAWSPDSQTFVSLSQDKTARLWRSTGQKLRELPGIIESPTAIAWSPDAKTFAIGTTGGLSLWSAAGDPITEINWGKDGAIVSLGWSPDGRIFAAGFAQGIIRLWQADAIRTATPASSSLITALHADNAAPLSNMVWSADSKEIAAGFIGGVQVWKTDGTPIIALATDDSLPVRQLAWCVGGALAYATADHVWLWQYKDGDNPDHKLHGPFTGSGSTLTALTWSSLGLLASGGYNGTAQIWDDKGKVLLTSPATSGGPVTSLAWSPDSRVLAIGYSDGSVRFWQVRAELESALKGDTPSPSPPLPSIVVTPSDADWAALEQRPFSQPMLPAGAVCPVTTATPTKTDPNVGHLLGAGPVYYVNPAAGAISFMPTTANGGWSPIKTLWANASTLYRGLIVLRGRQLDGPNEVRFAAGLPIAESQTELRWQTDEAFDAADWSELNSYTLLRAPGCYAYQVDGRNFSYGIVFKAVLQPAPQN